MKNIEVVFVSPEVEKSQENNILIRSAQVLAAGYFPFASGHDFARNPEKYFVIIYCTAGKGYYQYKNKVWEVNAGEILYCWKGTAHHYWADKDNPWTIFWLHAQGKEIDLLLKEVNLDALHPVLKIGVSSLLISLFREILDVLKQGVHYQNSVFCSAMLKQILSAQIYLLQKQNTEVEEDAPFLEILKFLSTHVNKTLDIATMAKHCHLSETYFIRKFKKKFGYSPVVYFNRLKVQSASHLLLMSNRSVKEISFSLGFEDPLYFSRLFRKVMGESPSDYRLKKKSQT